MDGRLILLALGGLFLMTFTQTAQAPGTRGIRNHNWLNIRYSAGNDWDGQTGQDADGFAKFMAPEWGIRAAAKLLTNYQKRGVDTVRGIVTTWAPAVENDTGAYIAHVAQVLGVDPDQRLNLATDLPALLHVMARHESGKLPDTAPTVINEGLRLLVQYA